MRAAVVSLVLCLSAPVWAQAQADDDIEIPARPAAPPAPPAAPPAPAPASAEEVAALRARLAEIEARLAAAEKKPAAPPPAAVRIPVFTTPARPDSGVVLDEVGLVLSGFTQMQYVGSQLSEDQLQQGGEPLNRDRFVLRAARVRVDGSWRWARVAVELSGNTVNGLYAGILRAETSFIWRNKKAGAPPYLMLTGGLQEIPFGYELPEGIRRRWFMERSLGSLALFPGTTDLGLRLSGGVSFFRYGLAVMNGVPVEERPGAPLTVNQRQPDFLGRVGLDSGAGRRWNVAGGVSFLTGRGFHPGSDARPGTVQWIDSNENGVFDGGELVPLPAVAATPSETFARWAFAADFQARVRSRIGWSQLWGEVVVASNLDRGLFRADPIAAGYDVRHLSGYLAFTQELFGYGVVGFRWDYYNPNADFAENRRGRLIPSDAAINTLSPLVGVAALDRLRVVFQYDAILDRLGRDARGVPTDLANHQWTLRVQGDF